MRSQFRQAFAFLSRPRAAARGASRRFGLVDARAQAHTSRSSGLGGDTMMMRALVFAAALFAAGAAHAEQFTIDPEHTQVAFRIDRMGFNHTLGRFDTIAGEIDIDEAHPERSTVHVVIQVASIDTGHDMRDEHLRAPRWFNAAQFPTMEFRSTKVTPIDATHATVVGDLTMLGQTNPVTLNVTLNRVGETPQGQGRRTMGFSATGALTRTQWGMTNATPFIGANVEITIEALAHRWTTPQQ
jgi:polyisoprenoid-binding protein YceI